MAWSPKFEDALCFANQLHQHQQRKGTGVPYITHVLGVAALVGDHGGSEDQVIAALLHDAIEDQAQHHDDLAGDILARYGQDVLDMVLALSDTVEHPKPPWQARKQAYIDHVIEAKDNDPALLVSICDKLYNARTLCRDFHMLGTSLFERFKASPEQSLWYYDRLASAFLDKQLPTPLQRAAAQSLRRCVDDLHELYASATQSTIR